MAKQNNGKGGFKQQDADLTSRPFSQLRGLKVGPSCLACQEPIVLKRQGNSGHGWMHSRCEGQHVPVGPQRVKVYRGKDGQPLPFPGSRPSALLYDEAETDDRHLFLEPLGTP